MSRAVYVARESFAAELGDERYNVQAGHTRVMEGHPLLTLRPDAFEPVGRGVEFEVEQATAAPGERRRR
jgi:hypothetical protein